MNPGVTPTLTLLGGNLPPSFGTANARTNRCWGRPRHSIQRNKTARNNLGGFLGPYLLGKIETATGSFVGGICYLCGSMLVSAAILFFLGLGHRGKAGK